MITRCVIIGKDSPPRVTQPGEHRTDPPVLVGRGHPQLHEHVGDVFAHRAGASVGQRRAVAWWESAAVVVSAGILTLLFTVPGVAVTDHIYRGAFFPDSWWRDILWGPLGVVLVVMWMLVAAVTVGTSRMRG